MHYFENGNESSRNIFTRPLTQKFEERFCDMAIALTLGS
jgi:hypothetical protein